jgi:cyclase
MSLVRAGRLAIYFVPALLATASFAQPVVRTADPATRGLTTADFSRTIHITDHFSTYEAFHAGPEKFTTTNMFVATDAGVLLADAQGSPAETQALVEAIRKVTPKPITTVVVCCDHGDHTGGNASLPAGVHYIIHPASNAILDRQAAARADAWKPPADAELVAEKKAWRMGGEELQILFLSEIFLNRVFPAMRSAYPSEWLGALTNAEKMDLTIYIAGHGFTEKGPVSTEELHNYHKALEAVIAETTRLYNTGVPADQAVKQANWGQYASWTMVSSRGPIAVRKVYEELSGQLT